MRITRQVDLKDAKDSVERYIAAHPSLQQHMNASGAQQRRKLAFAMAVAIAIGAAVFFFMRDA